ASDAAALPATVPAPVAAALPAGLPRRGDLRRVRPQQGLGQGQDGLLQRAEMGGYVALGDVDDLRQRLLDLDVSRPGPQLVGERLELVGELAAHLSSTRPPTAAISRTSLTNHSSPSIRCRMSSIASAFDLWSANWSCTV